jgi:hypothetical protein
LTGEVFSDLGSGGCIEVELVGGTLGILSFRFVIRRGLINVRLFSTGELETVVAAERFGILDVLSS